MENMTMSVKGHKLLIEVDLRAKGRPSSTGKSLLVATTAGAAAIDYAARPGVKVAVNVTAPNGAE